MAKQVVYPVKNEEGSYIFWCPGCECAHGINATWTFDGNLEQPTVSPSILARTGETRCHSFVKNGQIRYLNDCSHELAGQTIDLVPPPWEDE